MTLATRGDADRDAFIADATVRALDVPDTWINPSSPMKINLNSGQEVSNEFQMHDYAELTRLREKFKAETQIGPIGDKARWVRENYSYFTSRPQEVMVQPS